MKFPKLVIATDGEYTGVLMDGVFIGQGIERIEFSTQKKDGKAKSTIRIMELNVCNVKLETDNSRFKDFIEKLSDTGDRN